MSDSITQRLQNIIDTQDGVKKDSTQDTTVLGIEQRGIIDPHMDKFTGKHNSGYIRLHNNIGRYVIIRFKGLRDRDGTEHYRVTIEYGRVGTKCRQPIIVNFTTRDQAIKQANHYLGMMRRRGYITREVIFNQQRVKQE